VPRLYIYTNAWHPFVFACDSPPRLAPISTHAPQYARTLLFSVSITSPLPASFSSLRIRIAAADVPMNRANTGSAALVTASQPVTTGERGGGSGGIYREIRYWYAILSRVALWVAWVRDGERWCGLGLKFSVGAVRRLVPFLPPSGITRHKPFDSGSLRNSVLHTSGPLRFRGHAKFRNGRRQIDCKCLIPADLFMDHHS
jgi:hypothetical protein